MSLQVVEKSGEGLSRVLGVTVPAADLNSRLDKKIAEVTPTLRLKGFRPGKVPAGHVRRMFGKDLMREILQDALTESSQQALTDAKLRAASQPDLKMTSDPERVVAGQEDLAYDIEVEVMPEFQPVDVTSLELVRPVHEPTDAEVDAELQSLAEQSRSYAPKDGPAADGDQLTVDFVGRIDGTPFEGGSAEDAQITLGSGRFIPGFEEQLVGAAAGETRTLNVTFPETYNVETLKGRAAEFEVTVKAVSAPGEATVDDGLAERLGLGALDALRDAVRRNLADQYAGASRFKLKRALLDELDRRHDFPLPPRMVDAEFEVIWNQVHADLHAGRLSPEDQGKSHDELRAEYRRIAERRVRLGLVLAEIGRADNVSVSDAELNQAIMNEARNYPGQERQVFDFYRRNPQAAAQLRAPVYEEKVVELIFTRAKITDRPVSKEELTAEDDMPEGYAGATAAAAEPEPKATATPAKKKRTKTAAAEE